MTRAEVGRWACAALLGLAVACRSEPTASGPPLRPPAPGANRAQVLVDAEGVAHAGELVPSDRAFGWDPGAAAGGRLRLAWTAPQSRRATLVVEREDRGGKPPRVVASRTHEFPVAAAPSLWNEEVAIEGGGGPLRLRLDPPAPLFLSDVRLVAGESPQAVVLLLFDTTRRDAVGFGGCPDPSSPNLDAILRGAWKSERAYAAASWTIPSVASLLTGRVPAVHEDADGSPLGIVSGVPTLAADFRRAGWSTAAFVANPTLRAENGFAAGFDAYFVTPYAGASLTLPARETMRHVPSWLDAHRGEPFLLLINLLDPHDPYQPSDRRPIGTTPFDPGYRGPIRGDEVTRLQLGDPPAPSPADVRHLVALYHDEVRLADAEVGRLWNATPASERARWTVVFTADHGEEFGGHGLWKHGPDLFEEVLRVPLAIRPREGRSLPAIPTGALVSLLDVLPTIEGLAGLPTSRRPLEGRNLIDATSWSRESLPAVTMLTGGGARAAVIHPDAKLVFFDRLGGRGIPDAAKDPSGHRLALRLRELLAPLGRYDLGRDPGEKSLLPIERDRFGADWRAVEEAIAHTRRGIELRFVGAGGPAALDVSVEGFGSEAAVEPFALDPDDRFAWERGRAGRSLRARLDLGNDVDGFRFDDASDSDLRITAAPGGVCAALMLAGARPVPLAPGQTRLIPRAAIPDVIPRFESPGPCAGVYLWKATGKPLSRTAAEEEEAVRKLRALGYLH